MSEFLQHYESVHPTTWVYLSSWLILGLFFKFNRLWSVRNIDLLGLIALGPGLLLVESGRARNIESDVVVGFIWLFCVGGFFLIRMLIDPGMVRRPLLEANVTSGGLTFLGAALLVFLMANVLTSDSPRPVGEVVEVDQPRPSAEFPDGQLAIHGPGYPPLRRLPDIATQRFEEPADPPTATDVLIRTAKILAMISQLAIVIGLILIGLYHFDNVKTGIAAATLYLIIPYTAMMTGRVDHALPAALLVWAVVCYRRPLAAGVLIGVAAGAMYYPIFLLPLWCGFYWRKGLLRFGVGVLAALAVMVGCLAFSAEGGQDFFAQLRQMFGFIAPWNDVLNTHLQGFWAFDFIIPVYRLPVLAGFLAISFGLAIWPAQKNLGTLMSCSAAVMLGCQFWHAHDGGLQVAWYLPLMLAAILRPNLEDRIALNVLREPWLPKRLIRAAKRRAA
ncbi:MAG: hypothetical protein IID44_12420 [Planctomycetes bacterium]|nr:hypothetical protein [Planctomycetota bacterium]